MLLCCSTRAHILSANPSAQELHCKENELKQRQQQQRQQEENLQKREQELEAREIDCLRVELMLYSHMMNTQNTPTPKKRRGKFSKSRLKVR